MTKKIKQTDYAYIAGYIDGDGCFYIGSVKTKTRLARKPVVSIAISSVNRPVLDHFKKLFGGCVSLVRKAHGNKKSLYQYSIRKRNTVKLTENILIYLVEKREECMVTVDFAKSDDVRMKNSLISKMKILKDVSNLISKHHKKEFESIRNTVAPTINDFAYLAGFIDAECSLNIQKWKSKNRPNFIYKIILQCNNTKAPVFKWLSQRFGGQLHFIDRRKYDRKNQLTWRLSGRALSKILKDIYPFLKHKKPVCEELIKFYEISLPNGGNRRSEAFKTASASIIQEKEKIVSRVHKLNLKGIQTT